MSKELEGLIEAYVKVRDGIKEIKERHKQELAPWEQGLAEAEGALMTLLNNAGAESMKTNAGTAFKAQWSKAVVTDWQAVPTGRLPTSAGICLNAGSRSPLSKKSAPSLASKLSAACA